MLIRDATTSDWSRIWPFWHRIAVEAQTYTWDPGTGPDEARELWMEPPPARIFVVEDGPDLVASAQLHSNYGPASHVANASFIVDPDRAGQGIGRMLLQHVLDQARTAGYRAMVFNAVAETNTNAVRLYTSVGFRILGTVPEGFEHPIEGMVGLHIMHLRL